MRHHRFIRYAPYCESRKFKELIKGKIAEKPEIGYKFLQAVLQVRRRGRVGWMTCGCRRRAVRRPRQELWHGCSRGSGRGLRRSLPLL